jgi:site-specific DNA-methyltransferase (adenine-specific)
VLDPFCGCGTTIDAAERHGRQWIGIDVTHVAVGLIKHRLTDTFGDKVTYKVVGEPTDLEGARQLASEDRFQFQAWALGLVGARTAGSDKKGADKGIDGKLLFRDGPDVRTVVLSVKSGKPKATDVRDLRAVIERDDAAIGALLTLEPPTKPQETEAAIAGSFESDGFGKFPRLQIHKISDLVEGKARLEMPPRGTDTTRRRADAYEAQIETDQLTLD